MHVTLSDPSRLRISHQRLVMLLGVFTLLLAVSGQMLAVQAADVQANAQLRLQADQDEEQPPPEQEVQPSFIQIDKYDCPTGSDWSQASYEQLAQGCPANQNPVNITVNGETQSVGGSAQWGPFQDVTSFEISEEERQGYLPPIVVCGSYVPNESQPNLQFLGAAYIFNWQLQPGESLYCQIFNHQAGAQFATIIFHKFACPDSWDWQDPYAATIDELGQACATPLSNVQYDYELNGQVAGSLATDQQGNALWDQAPAGEATIREFLPSGYAFSVVHCSYHPADAAVNFAGNSQPVQMQDSSSFLWNVEAGFVLECYWFNFPTDQIQLYKYWCPAEMGPPDGLTLDAYQNACNEQPGADISWLLRNLATDQDITELGPSGDIPGYAGYHQFQQDEAVGITEAIPADTGYGTPILFCYEFQRGNPDGQLYAEAYDPESGVSWTPQVGFYLVCYFFNVQAEVEEFGQIVIEKYWCPAGLAFVQAPTLTDMQGACQDEGPGASFTLEGPESDPQPWSPMSPEGGPPATAGWEQVPPGNYAIYETGLGEGWIYTVYCTESANVPNGAIAADPEQQALIDGNGIAWTVQAGYTLTCTWFNQPPPDDEENSVTVYKWDCGPGTEFDRELEYYQGGLPDQETGPCETQHLDVPISLIDGNGEHPTTTQSDGTEWDGVVLDQNGSFQITEQIPEGYVDPMVFCGTLDEETQAMVPATGGTISITPTADPFTYQCNWYNIPIADYNYIDFYKYLCAPDALPDQDKTYYEENCEPVEGWEFDLQWTDGGSTESTDPSGQVGWSGVPIGAWQATETVPESYGEPYVWCRYLEWPEDATVDGNWLGQGAPGGVYDGNFDFEGMHIECHWYNFGTETEVAGEPGANWLTVYKYLCAPDVEPNEVLETMLELCTETQSGVQFALPGSQPSNANQQVTTGGVAEWQGLFAGTHTIQETLPPGYSPPLVWCGYVVQEGVELSSEEVLYSGYAVTDGAVQVEIEGENARVVCYWLNIPSDETTVTVYKFNCDFQPAGYQTLGQWLEACPALGNDWTFTLTDSEDNASEMVTASGAASWTGVPLGEFTLAETPESGWGEPVVWCGWTAFNDGAVLDAFPQQVETTAGEYTGEILYAGTSYFCFWFNIPVDHSSVVVFKYICPEGQLEGVVPNPLQAYLEMCTTPGNGIEFILETTEGESSATTLGGSVTWLDVPQGDITITETLPPGYDPPIWFCTEVGIVEEALTTEGVQSFVMNETEHSATIEQAGARYICWVFNFPDPDRTVEVFKWLCPEGYTGESYEDWSSNCTMPMDGVKFTVTDDNGNWPLNTVGGHATWYGVAQGDVTLDEHIPPGYFEPVIYCSLEAVNGAAIAEGFTEYPSTNGAISRSLEYSEYHWVCHVFDIPKGPGEITFYKWLCPPGYDIYAWGANPKVDCDQLWDGIEFTLDQPVGPNLQSTTGDEIPGAVYFGDLDPGTYVATETVPPDIAYVFVLDCTGSDDDKVHPYPLQWGNILTIVVAGGDSIVCNWYNVPDPENGWITLYKYQCWTPTYTSSVDCEIYEHGATFELFDVQADDSYGVGTTNVGGLYTWYDLPEGSYDLDEISHKPCKVTTTKHDGQGHIWVDAGQGTVVKVYNCKPKIPPPPGTPTIPGKQPVKYPNTGAGPDGAEAITESMAQATPEGTPDGTPEASAEDYFLISCLDVTPEATPETVDEAEDEPSPTPTPTGTEEEFDLPIDEEAEDEVATPDGGSPAPEEECVRGALPERVVVDAAQVDAGVEILEIIDGVMEQPTGPELVTWYKETGRLGEDNNVVIAGHLNYWGVPQGVFFYLDQLREGDRVEVTGDDGKTYVFEVEWVRQESNLAPPDAEVIGTTDVPSLTLITCGGEWNADISEYDERTVARAVMVEVIDPPET